MGRHNHLEDKEYCKAIAEAYVSGATLQEIADAFGVSRGSIRTWSRDPRVTTHITRLTKERVNRITRKIDSVIEARLESAENWKIEELLKARKEFLERMLPKDVSEDVGSTVNEISEAMDENPELAEALRNLAGG